MLASWYAAENGMNGIYESSKKLIKRFHKGYIYIKGYEIDYGEQIKQLCNKVETVKYL